MSRILIVSLLLISCTTIEKSEKLFSFTNLTGSASKEIILDKELQSYKLILKLEGILDKPGSITISNSERVIHTYFLTKGEVDKVIRSDWYDSSCSIEFKTKDKNNGYIDFKATFL